MPRRLSAYVHERAGGATVAARQASVQIMRELAKEDIETTRHIVTRWIFCWMKGTGLADQSR